MLFLTWAFSLSTLAGLAMEPEAQSDPEDDCSTQSAPEEYHSTQSDPEDDKYSTQSAPEGEYLTWLRDNDLLAPIYASIKTLDLSTVAGIYAAINYLENLKRSNERFNNILTNTKIREILENVGITPDFIRKAEKNSDSPLLNFAVYKGNAFAIKIIFLIDGINQECKVTNDHSHWCDYTPILMAAELNKTAVIKALLAGKANPNVKVYVNYKGVYTPLLLVSESNNTEAIEALLKKGANPNVKVKQSDSLLNGCTPLRFAVSYKNIRAIHALITKGAMVPGSLLLELNRLGISEIPEKQMLWNK